ncbi:UDP-N-acetylglucosamine transferase subunit ALG14 homolog [Portunus trituberculatus]|uniref:UDP-N-acetylglucosamine transferase subunit ALG14 homolog n=1 Tax=Portunus trituberculatus TaxID=210409 RepID=UPI001E1CF506|nr:UDP-N-acetylglucosamine transferase subunit ALG14 homolog [Portunus trituberculatus]XP_045112641.1 UDP-N-acetylglucosamine transferase subunit ALG14 homolog [Portunus trituberculatus]XP_045112642.1 UDP-N-acetylglucosamine transferase subunit ALG14 homolog [Portunus trituberculatus]
MLVLIAGTVLVLVALVARLVYVLYDIHQGKPLVLPQHKTVKTLVVLGSGGHTVEMLKMVAALDPVKYSPRMYVVADTDEISHKKLLEVEKDFKDEGHYMVEVVPRTREVGQSWITSAFTTLHALISSLLVLVRHRPLLILSNGPGTCVPLCGGAVMLRVLGVCPSRIVFVESLCRVHSLSLSGWLLYPLSDHFLVQWPQLTESHPRARCLGRLV